MTLRKAYELLQSDIDDPGSVPIGDLIEAEKLAVEVLKWTAARRLATGVAFTPQFKGETIEG